MNKGIHLDLDTWIHYYYYILLLNIMTLTVGLIHF